MFIRYSKKQEILANAEKKFVEKYDVQHEVGDARDVRLDNQPAISEIEEVVSNANPQPLVTYKIGPMQNLSVAFKGARAINDAKMLDKHSRYKVVLFSLPSPQAAQQIGVPFEVSHFYKFNYNPAGLAAFQALRQLNPIICQDTQKRDKNITQMLLAYSTLAQMARNPEQRVYGKGALIGYFDKNGSEVENRGGEWIAAETSSGFEYQRICKEWHDKEMGVYAYYRDGYDQSISSAGDFSAEEELDFNLDTAQEIAIRVIDDEHLSLEDRHFILQGMRKFCIDKHSNMFKAAESSPRVEEVVDDVAYDNAAYARYTK